MAYRNGTYVTFHAGGTTNPTESDIKYYNTLKMWDANKHIDFKFVNSHDKTSAVRDTSKRETLYQRLRDRLNESKNMILILTEDTKLDTDCVPFEIRYAADDCQIPFIICYPDYRGIFAPQALAGYWPAALAKRINEATIAAIHIPFRKEPILDAINQFTVHSNPLRNALEFYDEQTHRRWNLMFPYEKAVGNIRNG